jgi:cell division protein FtsZ
MFELMDAYSQNAIIKVIGVGGGGGNAVKHMANCGIEGVALVGPEPDASAELVESTIRPFRDVVKKLGRPVGRRSALSEPAVILSRVVQAPGDTGSEPDEDDE